MVQLFLPSKAVPALTLTSRLTLFPYLPRVWMSDQFREALE